LVLKDTQELL